MTNVFDLDKARAERRKEQPKTAPTPVFKFKLNRRTWTTRPNDEIDLRMLADVDATTPTGIMQILKEMLGDEQWAQFPRIVATDHATGDAVSLADVMAVYSKWIDPQGEASPGE